MSQKIFINTGIIYLVIHFHLIIFSLEHVHVNNAIDLLVIQIELEVIPDHSKFVLLDASLLLLSLLILANLILYALNVLIILDLLVLELVESLLMN